jgi:hypothetical protein
MYERLKSAGVLKAEMAVTAFCFLLPDLADKPLWMLEIGMGRFVGPTLLMVFLVASGFFLIRTVWSRRKDVASAVGRRDVHAMVPSVCGL